MRDITPTRRRPARIDSVDFLGVPSLVSALVNLIRDVKRASEFGAFSEGMLTFQIDALRKTAVMRDFLTTYDAKYRGAADAYGSVFRFLRACEC